MNLSHYSEDRVRELCAMPVKELDKELLNLCREITKPCNVSISFTTKDVEALLWKMAFIQRIQNQKRRNPHRVVKHVEIEGKPYIVERY